MIRAAAVHTLKMSVHGGSQPKSFVNRPCVARFLLAATEYTANAPASCFSGRPRCYCSLNSRGPCRYLFQSTASDSVCCYPKMSAANSSTNVGFVVHSNDSNHSLSTLCDRCCVPVNMATNIQQAWNWERDGPTVRITRMIHPIGLWKALDMAPSTVIKTPACRVSCVLDPLFRFFKATGTPAYSNTCNDGTTNVYTLSL